MPTSLSRALARDVDAAFEDLVVSFQDGLFGFAVGLCGDFAKAEEIVQEAFFRAYRALKGYSAERRETLAVKSWLYQVTLNVFRNSVRGRAAGLTTVAEPPDTADPAPGPEELALRFAECRALLESLGALPEPLRVTVVLRYVRDLSYAEIADVLDQPVGTVKSNVHRGIEMLRHDFLQEVS